MSIVHETGSGVPTLDASNLAYQFERVQIEYPDIPKDSTGDYDRIREATKENALPQNLAYLNDFYDKSTGTSGVAFRDKATGEVIVAYTGTNPNVQGFDGKIEYAKDIYTDIKDIIFGKGNHYDPAYAFYEDMSTKYGAENIVITGHSLGGNIAQRVALKYNAPNTIVYNSAPLFIPSTTFTGISIGDPFSAIASAHTMTELHMEMVRFRGKVGRITTTKDFLNKVSDQFQGVYLGEEFILTNSGGHGLEEIINSRSQVDELKQLFATEPSLSTALRKVDVNGDGTVDLSLYQRDLIPRNLFLSSGRISSIGAKDIKLDPDSLRNLSSNLQMLSLVEIASLIKLCQLCQEKNTKIKEDFETRKQKVEESIVQRFKETRLTEVFYQLHDSVGQLLAKKQIFQTLMTPGQVVDTISDPAYFSTGAPLYLETYNIQLGRLGQYSSTLYQHATEEKTSGFQNGVPINPTPTALKSSMVLEESAKHLKERSETIFEGKGLREGKKDGISLALDEVLSVEQKNLLELQKALSSVSQLTLSLANHFQTMDDWLHDQLSNGGNLEGMMVANVPPSYKAYLEASHIFDDVKDVLQAFDHQVEENSKRYGKEVVETFTQAFSSLQTALDRWSSELTSFNQTISSIQATFTTGIYVDKTSFVDKKPVVTRTYWGQLWRLYPSTTYSTVNTAKNTITPLADKVISALEVTRTASHDMQNLKPQLKKIIEEGVYKAFDLDEIVASQKAIQSITDRILRELTYVITTISSQMQGEAVTTLTQQLEKVKSLTSYFNSLVGDCFGDQSKAQGATSTGSVSLEARTFSLNK